MQTKAHGSSREPQNLNGPTGSADRGRSLTLLEDRRSAAFLTSWPKKHLGPRALKGEPRALKGDLA